MQSPIGVSGIPCGHRNPYYLIPIQDQGYIVCIFTVVYIYADRYPLTFLSFGYGACKWCEQINFLWAISCCSSKFAHSVESQHKALQSLKPHIGTGDCGAGGHVCTLPVLCQLARGGSTCAWILCPSTLPQVSQSGCHYHAAHEHNCSAGLGVVYCAVIHILGPGWEGWISCPPRHLHVYRLESDAQALCRYYSFMIYNVDWGHLNMLSILNAGAGFW